MSAPGRLERCVVLAATAVLTVIWTIRWLPDLASVLPDGALSGRVVDGADARIVVWAMAWEAHALLTQPLAFFDANIFYPSRGMLTGSDTFLSAAALAAPVYWLTGNALLAANCVTVAGYGLCVLLTYAVVRRTGSGPVASLLAGIAVALGPFRVPADVHTLQYPSWILPLVLLGCFRAERLGRGGWWLASLAILFGLFASFYMAAMVMLLVGVEVALVAFFAGVPRALRLALATVPGLLVLGLLAVPWLARGGEAGTAPVELLPTFEIVAQIFQPAYLNPSHPIVGVGWAIAGLALLGSFEPLLRRGEPTVAWWRWVLLLFVGMVFAAGPSLSIGSARVPLPYGLLLDTPLRALRAFPRFFILAHLGLAGLAARGATLALQWVHARAGSLAYVGAAAIALLAVLVPRSILLVQTPFTHLAIGRDAPTVYERLAEGEPGPLLEVPGPWSAMALGRKLVQADFMIQSASHWRPLLNGHTGYPPWWYAWLRREIYLIPDDPSALTAVVDSTALKYILVHRTKVGSTEWERWRQGVVTHAALEKVEETDDHLLVRVRLDPDPSRPWEARLRGGIADEGTTILGTSRGLLSSVDVAGALDLVAGPESIAPSAPLSLHVLARNEGNAAWPALAPERSSEEGLVVLQSEWVNGGGRVASTGSSRLMRDVLAGESQHNWMELAAPEVPGEYELRISLRQVGGRAFDEIPPLRTRIVVAPLEVGSPPTPPITNR